MLRSLYHGWRPPPLLTLAIFRTTSPVTRLDVREETLMSMLTGMTHAPARCKNLERRRSRLPTRSPVGRARYAELLLARCGIKRRAWRYNPHLRGKQPTLRCCRQVVWGCTKRSGKKERAANNHGRSAVNFLSFGGYSYRSYSTTAQHASQPLCDTCVYLLGSRELVRLLPERMGDLGLNEFR